MPPPQPNAPAAWRELMEPEAIEVGFEGCRLLRTGLQSRKRVPRLVLPGDAQAPQEGHARSVGIGVVIRQGFELQVIATIVREQLYRLHARL